MTHGLHADGLFVAFPYPNTCAKKYHKELCTKKNTTRKEFPRY